MPFFYPIYPLIPSDTTVKATTVFSADYRPYFAVSSYTSLNGTEVKQSWVTSTSTIPQKFNVDYDTAFVPKGLYIENYHHLGGTVNNGVAYLTVYGTNSSTAFNNTVASNLTDLTSIGVFSLNIHIAEDRKDSQFFSIFTEDAYRYYVLIITGLFTGQASYYGFRRMAICTTPNYLDILNSTNKYKLVTPLIKHDKQILKSFLYKPSNKAVFDIWKRGIIKTTLHETFSRYTKIYEPPQFKSIVNPFEKRRVNTQYDGISTTLLDVSATIDGVVTVEGVIWSNVLVRLYYRQSGTQIDFTYTNEQGEFVFRNLVKDKRDFFVVAFKDDYNAIVIDEVKATGADVYVPEGSTIKKVVFDTGALSPILWLDANDITSLTYDAYGVSLITDVSNNDRNAEQPTQSRRPLYDNNDNSLNFTDTTKTLKINNPHSNTQTLFIVLNPKLDDIYVVFGTNSTDQNSYCLTGQINNTGNPLSGGDFGLPTYLVNGVDPSWGTSRDAVFNKLTNKKSLVVIKGFASGLELSLSNYSDSFPNYAYMGAIYEVISFSGSLSEGQIQYVEGYLAWKHKLINNFPVTHAHKEVEVVYYYSVFPSAFTDVYIKASSSMTSTYSAEFAFDYNNSLIGVAELEAWLVLQTNLPARINVDYGREIIPERVYIENFHYSGYESFAGVKNLRIYGTNTSSVFSNSNPIDFTDLTLLVDFEVEQHSAVNAPYPTYYTIDTHGVAYRYITYIVMSVWNTHPYTGFRRIEMQTTTSHIFKFNLLSDQLILSNLDLSITKNSIQEWTIAQTIFKRYINKVYWEIKIDSTVTNNLVVGGSMLANISTLQLGEDLTWGLNGFSGQVYYQGILQGTCATFTQNDIIGIAVDLDSGKVFFAINNVWFGNPITGTSPVISGITGGLSPAVSLFTPYSSITGRFIYESFTYTPPTNYAPYGKV